VEELAGVPGADDFRPTELDVIAVAGSGISPGPQES
jgi:hypothetical protein